MANTITFTCTRGYPMSGGTAAFMGSDAHLVKPVQRERFTAAAGVTAVQTARRVAPIADLPTTVPSALTCELRT